MEVCYDGTWQLLLLVLFAVLGAVSALRMAASAVMHEPKQGALRLNWRERIMGERSAPRQLRNPDLYYNKNSDKYHIEPSCRRLQAWENNLPARRLEYCELCGGDYMLVATRKPKVS